MNKLLSYPDMEFKINEIPEGKLVSYDCETTGLNPYKGDKPFLFSFATIEGDISIVECNPDTEEMLRTFFADESISKVCHNAKFDIKMAKKYDYEVKGTMHDTQVMAHLIDTYEPSFVLENLTEKYIKEFKPVEKELLEGWFENNNIVKAKRKYYEVPTDIMHPYAAVDAWNCIQLFFKYKERIREVIKMYGLDMKVQNYLIDIEDRGVLIDKGIGKEIVKELIPLYEKEQNKVKELTGMVLEPTKRRGIAAALFAAGEKCIEISEKSKEAKLGKEYLKQYTASFVPHLIEMIDLNRDIKDIKDQILGKVDKNNVIHTSFNLSKAVTGRFSSSGPNMQNKKVGSIIRKLFINRPKFNNFYLDYSQIELRLFAHFSKSKGLIEGFQDTDFDMHQATADKLGIERSVAKTINFSLLYGSGAKNLAKQLNVSHDKATELLKEYHAKMPALKKLQSKLSKELFHKGYIEDPFGKRYYVPIKDNYKCANALIQGCACNIFKKAMLAVRPLLTDKKSNLIQLIHDEMIFEIHEDEMYLIPQLKELMEDMPEFDVPLTVDIEYTKTNWLEKKKYEKDVFLAEAF